MQQYIIHMLIQWQIRGEGFLGFHGTPFGLAIVLRATDDRLNGIPPPPVPPRLIKEVRKLLLWLTLACLSENLDQKLIS